MKLNNTIICERCASSDVDHVSDGITNYKVVVDYVCSDCDLFFTVPTKVSIQDYVANEKIISEVDIYINRGLI